MLRSEAKFNSGRRKQLSRRALLSFERRKLSPSSGRVLLFIAPSQWILPVNLTNLAVHFRRGTVKRLIDGIVGRQTRRKNQGKRITKRRRRRLPVPIGKVNFLGGRDRVPRENDLDHWIFVRSCLFPSLETRLHPTARNEKRDASKWPFLSRLEERLSRHRCRNELQSFKKRFVCLKRENLRRSSFASFFSFFFFFFRYLKSGEELKISHEHLIERIDPPFCDGCRKSVTAPHTLQGGPVISFHLFFSFFSHQNVRRSSNEI